MTWQILKNIKDMHKWKNLNELVSRREIERENIKKTRNKELNDVP